MTHLCIDGVCLGKAFLAVLCASGVTILGGIALARVFGPGRRVGARDRGVVASRGLAPVEVEGRL